jgi:hypothetical protein
VRQAPARQIDERSRAEIVDQRHVVRAGRRRKLACTDSSARPAPRGAIGRIASPARTPLRPRDSAGQ